MKKIYSHGEITRIIRTLRGYSESKAATMLNMSQASYSYLETHRKIFDGDLLEKIANMLGVSRGTIENFDPDVLLNGIENNHDVASFQAKRLNNFIESKDNIQASQKEEIMALKKNIVGLRRQLQEQNDTIRELRTVVDDQQQTNKELRKLLVQKLGGGVKTINS